MNRHELSIRKIQLNVGIWPMFSRYLIIFVCNVVFNKNVNYYLGKFYCKKINTNQLKMFVLLVSKKFTVIFWMYILHEATPYASKYGSYKLDSFN